jgi:hypothetical protein
VSKEKLGMLGGVLSVSSVSDAPHTSTMAITVRPQMHGRKVKIVKWHCIMMPSFFTAQRSIAN